MNVNECRLSGHRSLRSMHWLLFNLLIKPREASLQTSPMSSPKSHSSRIPHGQQRPIALRDHPHVQTVLVRLEKRKLDNSINGEAYRTAKIQLLAGLDLALRSKVTMEQYFLT